MNKDIEIKNIEIKEDNNNLIEVKITNEPETMIAAHNASQKAHESIVGEINGKIEAIQGQINELEENMVTNTNIPKKLSDFENDEKFVSEQTVINAIETRGLVNNATLNQKEVELQNLITINANIYNTKLENIKTDLASSTNSTLITDYCAPSTKTITVLTQDTDTSATQTFTMPANGILYGRIKATNIHALCSVGRLDIGIGHYTNAAFADAPGTIEINVRKGERIQFYMERCVLSHVLFYYLCGNAPADEENKTSEEND